MPIRRGALLDLTLTPRNLLGMQRPEVVLCAVTMRWWNVGSSEQGERKLNSKLTTLSGQQTLASSKIFLEEYCGIRSCRDEGPKKAG